MSKVEAQNKYLETFMDRDIESVENAYEIAMLKESRAKMKAMLRGATTEHEKKIYEKQINDLTIKIDENK